MNVIATMATYPPRIGILEKSIGSLAPQVDRLNIVLNQYEEAPHFLYSIPNVNVFLPDQDLKDVGKFYPTYNKDDLVFLADDDLEYSASYVKKTISRATKIGMKNTVFGYHARTYKNERFSRYRRRQFHFRVPNLKTQVVDQLGTGTLFGLGKNIAPLDYMLGSQKFCDVRYAKWTFEQGINQVVLAHGLNMIKALRHGEETIYSTFTLADHAHFIQGEIKTYAGKNPFLRQTPHDLTIPKNEH